MLYRNCRLWTNGKNPQYFEDGALIERGGVIEAVGSLTDLLPLVAKDEESVDLKGRLVMPGFINAHTHIYSAYARGLAPSKPTGNFFEILENMWWALDRRLEVQDCRLNAEATIKESLRNGVTTLFDHHSSPHCARGSLFAIAEAVRESGIRASLCYELSDRDGLAIRDEEIKENVEFIRYAKSDETDHLHALFGMHASFTLSDESLALVREALEENDAAVHVHVAEGIEDELACLKEHGKRVIPRLQDFGLLGPKSLLIHAIHCSPEELDIIKESGAALVHNPMSNMSNAVGASPVIEMLRRGLPVGLGTDAYTHDMLVSVQVAKILQSLVLHDPTKGFSEALQLLFQGNPEICSRYFRRPLGVLEKGAYADFISLDYRPFTPISAGNMGGHIIFGLQGAQVQDVFVDGRPLMRDRELLTLDEERIDRESTLRARKIWPTM